MRRADRLFELVHLLRGRRLTTAAQLAEWLEVSERTIYRDVADLLASGVPIDGEAGVGYRLRPEFDLPPLMFNRIELEALVLGARMVEAWGGPSLAQGARTALSKISAVLPNEGRASIDGAKLFSPDFFIDPRLGEQMELARTAVNQRRYLTFDYLDAKQAPSSRRVRPLGLFFWGGAWSLGAWCELRQDFRNFRLDRIQRSEVEASLYPDQVGRRLPDYLRAMACDEDRR